MTNRTDELYRSISRIESLKNNLPDDYEIENRWVVELHDALRRIEESFSLQLSEFMVSPNEVKPSVASSNPSMGTVTYRKGLWCERAILLQKVDAVLGYLRRLLSREEKIGFQQEQ